MVQETQLLEQLLGIRLKLFNEPVNYPYKLTFPSLKFIFFWYKVLLMFNSNVTPIKICINCNVMNSIFPKAGSYICSVRLENVNRMLKLSENI